MCDECRAGVTASVARSPRDVRRLGVGVGVGGVACVAAATLWLAFNSACSVAAAPLEGGEGAGGVGVRATSRWVSRASSWRSLLCARQDSLGDRAVSMRARALAADISAGDVLVGTCALLWFAVARGVVSWRLGPPSNSGAARTRTGENACWCSPTMRTWCLGEALWRGVLSRGVHGCGRPSRQPRCGVPWNEASRAPRPRWLTLGSPLALGQVAARQRVGTLLVPQRKLQARLSLARHVALPTAWGPVEWRGCRHSCFLRGHVDLRARALANTIPGQCTQTCHAHSANTTHTHARHVCTTYVHRGPASREPAVQRYCLRPHAVPATTGAGAGSHRGTHAWGPTKSPRSRRHRSRMHGRALAGGELVPAVWGWRPNLHGAGAAGKVVPTPQRARSEA